VKTPCHGGGPTRTAGTASRKLIIFFHLQPEYGRQVDLGWPCRLSSASASVFKRASPPNPDGRTCSGGSDAHDAHEAGSSVKAGTAAALITDHERQAVVAGVPYSMSSTGLTNACELHDHSTALQIRGLSESFGLGSTGALQGGRTEGCKRPALELSWRA